MPIGFNDIRICIGTTIVCDHTNGDRPDILFAASDRLPAGAIR